MTDQELFDLLGDKFEQKIQNKTEFRGETTYEIAANNLHARTEKGPPLRLQLTSDV